MESASNKMKSMIKFYKNTINTMSQFVTGNKIYY